MRSKLRLMVAASTAGLTFTVAPVTLSYRPSLSLAAAAPTQDGNAAATSAAPGGVPGAVVGGKIEDVVVTAQKRAERLQRVPITVQVVQGQALRGQNTNSLQDLSQVLPDLHIQSSGDQIGNSLSVRGVGSGANNPTFDQSVAVFEDDIYYGRSKMIQDTFLDVDRVEVLKGPQSTYFGNNAISGALNISTKKPDDHYDGYVRALYGSYGAYALEGAASLPVADTLSIRVAGTTNGMSGWIENLNTDKTAPGEQNYAGRITVSWKPSEDFDATLKVEDSSNLITGAYNETPSQWTNCPPPAPLPDSAINKQCPAALAFDVPLGLHNDVDSTLAGQFSRLQTNTNELTLNYNLGDVKLTSVTGYYDYNYAAQQDNGDVGNHVLTTVQYGETFSQFSQELRATTPANLPVENMIGGYFQKDNGTELLNGNAAFANQLLEHALGFPADELPLGYAIGYKQAESIYALFDSLSWHATDQLKFNLGIRGIWDDKNFVGNVNYGRETQTYGGLVSYPENLQKLASIALGEYGTYPYTREDRAVTPSAGVQYQLTPDKMLYATYTRGFLAGGFSGTAPAPLTTTSGTNIYPVYGPEFVTAFEGGVKTKWLDDRLLINLDYFHEQYSGLQLNSRVELALNAATIPQNAATAVSQGVELQSEWAISKIFRVTANVTYLNADYTKYPNASPTVLQTYEGIPLQNLAGRPLDFAANWSGSVTGEFKIHLNDNLVLDGSVTPIFTTKYYNSLGTDDSLFLVPGSLRLDAKMTLEDPIKGWAVDFIGKNLTDAVIPLSYGTGDSVGGKEEPINFAVQLRYKW